MCFVISPARTENKKEEVQCLAVWVYIFLLFSLRRGTTAIIFSKSADECPVPHVAAAKPVIIFRFCTDTRSTIHRVHDSHYYNNNRRRRRFIVLRGADVYRISWTYDMCILYYTM